MPQQPLNSCWTVSCWAPKREGRPRPTRSAARPLIAEIYEDGRAAVRPALTLTAERSLAQGLIYFRLCWASCHRRRCSCHCHRARCRCHWRHRHRVHCYRRRGFRCCRLSRFWHHHCRYRFCRRYLYSWSFSWLEMLIRTNWTAPSSPNSSRANAREAIGFPNLENGNRRRNSGGPSQATPLRNFNCGRSPVYARSEPKRARRDGARSPDVKVTDRVICPEQHPATNGRDSI